MHIFLLSLDFFSLHSSFILAVACVCPELAVYVCVYTYVCVHICKYVCWMLMQKNVCMIVYSHVFLPFIQSISLYTRLSHRNCELGPYRDISIDSVRKRIKKK